MYKEHTAKQAIIAVVYYVLLIAGFLTMGICHQRQIDYEWIYWGLFLIPVAVVLLGDRNINDLGFSGKFIKAIPHRKIVANTAKCGIINLWINK